ncbi:nucleotide kinase domain-containing protein [Rheinheimera sp. MM224]|uniref:nucleotide kinase domain-containing protein n=1 Tax=Rheinheimera sp. MM224 TaxID=3019969 RepID=UPI0021F91A2A|nr:nucleotide kinase domain-containing protein [Rheinheimera sp. MM224]CAI3805395.1 hypothetical protein JAMGFMIE_03862 [Rheinheimera sp. MM224]
MKIATLHDVFIKKQPPKLSVVFETYWRFAYLRQQAFFSRLYSTQGPWSDDKIINEFKFTNAYRASDRVSQYLIKHVIYSKKWSIQDTVLRTLLFKFFNKIETWQLLEKAFGEISLKTFSVEAYAKVLQEAMDKRITIYSAAYIIPSGPKRDYEGKRKHQFHLTLLRELMQGGFIDDLIACKSMKAAYQRILQIESLGKFLAYQFVTDLNYSDHFQFSEQEFVVPGPGALDGIRKCFTHLGDYTETDIIHFMMDSQEHQFSHLNYPFQNLWGRDLQLIDCQNLFCEVDKYSRVAHPDIMGISGRMRIKQKFKPQKAPVEVWYPPKWGLNDKISKDFSFPELAIM